MCRYTYRHTHTYTQIHVCGRRLRPGPKIGCVGIRTSPQRRGMMRWVSWAFSSLCFLAGQAMQSVRFISCYSLATTMSQLALWFLFTRTLCTYVVTIADIVSLSKSWSSCGSVAISAQELALWPKEGYSEDARHASCMEASNCHGTRSRRQDALRSR